MGEIVFHRVPKRDQRLSNFFGGLLHVEVVSNRYMIDLFKSLVTSISKGLNNLRPRATSCGFCEVL